LVTKRIAAECEGKRDDFIVAKMYYDCVECSASMDYPGAKYWLPKDYSAEKDPHDYKTRRYSPVYCLCHTCYLSTYQKEYNAAPEIVVPDFPPKEWETHPAMTNMNPSISRARDLKSPINRKRKLIDLQRSQLEILEAGEIARVPNPYGNVPPCSLKNMTLQVAMIRPWTSDADPRMDSPIFNTREEFLSFCQGNKYQFDELRRAKHSSMMILFHLQHPDQDAFVHSCDHCGIDIKLDERYSCPQCPDFDLCIKCHLNGNVQHPHKLEKHQVDSTIEENIPQQVNTAKREAYFRAFEHCMYCPDDSSNCEVACHRMKKVIKHRTSCSIGGAHGCKTCRIYWKCLSFHASNCRETSCQPVCERMKKHLRDFAARKNDPRLRAHRIDSSQNEPVCAVNPEC
jgi:hypothetical protein